MFISFEFSASFSSLPAADTWLVTAGGAGEDRVVGVTLALNGDILITGSVSTNASFGTTQITNNPGNAFFIARYDATGGLLWVTNGSGSGVTWGQNVLVDGPGNAYVTAWNSDLLDLGNGISVPLDETQPGPSREFVACYSPSGRAHWAALRSSLGRPIVQDPVGRVLAYSGTSTYLDDGTHVRDSVLGVLNTQGGMTPLAAWRLMGDGSSPDEIAVQNDGQFWLSGSLGQFGRVTFSSQIFLEATNTGPYYFLAKFSADGTPLGIIGNPNLEESQFDRHFAADGQGNLFFAWIPEGTFGVRVSKHNPSGLILWERDFDSDRFGVLISNLGFVQTSFVVNNDGHLFIASYYHSHLNGDRFAIIRQLNVDGDVVAQRVLHTTVAQGISLAGIGIAPDGSVITAGNFLGGLTIDDQTVESVGADIFVARFRLLPVESPRLLWARTASSITWTWPPGFILQSTRGLDPVDWQDQAGGSPLTMPIDSGARFFRLRSE